MAQNILPIELTRVDFAYADHQVVRGLSFHLRQGESCSVVGPAGSGKSTLLKLAVGLLRPSAGEVRFFGRNTHELSYPDRRRRARELSMGFQNSGLFDSVSCGENLCFPLREHTSLGEAEIAERATGALSQVGLEGVSDRMVHELSGGMQKRLGIARAFILNPKIVLLDDPTAGLDPITSRSIVNLILEYKKSRDLTLVVVTSDVPRAFEIGERVILMNAGRIVEDETSEAARKPGKKIYRFMKGESVND